MSIHNLYSIFPIDGVFYRFDRALHAYAYYLNHRINLITGEKENCNISEFTETLEIRANQKYQDHHVIHLFYEFSYVVESLVEYLNGDEILVVDILYKEKSQFECNKESQKIDLELIEEISFSDYEKKFKEGYDELLNGNCYQFNLTSSSLYKFDKSIKIEKFVERIWRDNSNVSEFAHFTYIEFLKKAFLSNSPECLFSYSNGSITTRPIKGTVKRNTDDKNEILKLWRELCDDEKNQAELYMITDLLKNDLSRIEKPNAKVLKLKEMLIVPGLVHQYSEISVGVSPEITLKKIIFSLFPGGSITGAPKKNSIRIIKKLEVKNREFYCGSTILHSKENLKASINIRSAEIDLQSYILKYSSGGGITLKSDQNDEFSEMNDKKSSFISLF